MSQLPQLTLPPTAQERLAGVAQFYKVDISDLYKETLEIFNSDFMQNDNTFKTVEDKLDYCTKVIKSRYVARPPLIEVDVIVIGLGRVFNTRTGTKRGEIYVMVQEEQKDKTLKSVLRSVVFQGSDTDKILNIQTCCAYKVKLGKFKTGDFIADDRSRFENPVKLDVPILQILDALQIHRCTVATSVDNLAKEEKTSTGTYMIRTDCRVIRGMIADYRKGQSKEGQEWGVYTIFDDSLQEEYISPDGKKIVKPAFTVWVNPLWVMYEKGNEVDFVGPLSVNPDTKEVSMTAFLLIPVRTSFGGIKE